ncbi:oxidoreductase [Rhodococcus sp. NPDC127528]|uniref:oxidoreductase n=1 Tax=unclassified Rhodococcus (in: high G+C Gram-positive bacteria) TaxID=192944 RepID=UPI00363D4094
MDLQLKSKTAVVTGASKGIGLAITEALVAEGANVVAGARTRTDEISVLESDGTVTFVPVDLSTAEGPQALVDAATSWGGIDVLVNNAGAVTPRPNGFASVTDDDWFASLTLTFLSAVRTTRAALPQFNGRGGSIVTVSSVNAFLPDPAIIDYCAAKAALTNFCKSLSKEVASQGIRVNTVSPGPVTTALWTGAEGVAATVSRASGIAAQDVIDHTAASTETGRFTSPQEVADLVVFLASSRAANITGADFVIDGGLIKTL